MLQVTAPLVQIRHDGGALQGEVDIQFSLRVSEFQGRVVVLEQDEIPVLASVKQIRRPHGVPQGPQAVAQNVEVARQRAGDGHPEAMTPQMMSQILQAEFPPRRGFGKERAEPGWPVKRGGADVHVPGIPEALGQFEKGAGLLETRRERGDFHGLVFQ